ncbi:coiled-coil domain-containing protein 171-like isoform X2 [Corticium candelabrum]|uniref:coiled-coil domain-containing protein 171-like isoform X2 n=1 Tax=Corticium candelabrum TaxID=121492 RepID=UPI002E25FA34|nr:coiled-coil domain-containing protein 171-like isoform X2 [Corticium candelabrum]
MLRSKLLSRKQGCWTVSVNAKQLTQLKRKTETLQSKLASQSEIVKKQAGDLESRTGHDEKMKREVEAAYARLRDVEESYESERAAHLESKFNAELVQLRVRDLEAALEAEKVAGREACMSVEMLKQQLRDIENSLENEQKQHLSLGANMEEQQREWVSKEIALTAQLEEKQSLVGRLSEQLEHHEKNLKLLKTQLFEARQTQKELEEKYISCLRELEMLVRSMQPTSGSPENHSASSKLVPSAILGSLKQLLTNYQSNVSRTSSQLSAFKSDVDRLTSECEHYKEAAQSKENALKEVQTSLSQAEEKLVKITAETSHRNELVDHLTSKLQRKSERLLKERERRQAADQQLAQCRQNMRTDNENKCQYLQSLYDRLVAGRVVLDGRSPQVQFTWPELTTMVAEQVSSALLEVQRLKNKVDHIESVVKRKDEALNEVNISHQQGLSKLSQAAQQREKTWQQQRWELESHYNGILQELQSKAEKSQALTDQAWERVHSSDEKQDRLQAEYEKLRSKVDRYESDMILLQTGCGLLGGALLSQFNSIDMLVTHKRMLSERCRLLDELQQRISLLVDDMSINGQSENSRHVREVATQNAVTFSCTKHRLPVRYDRERPVMRFRVAVIVVLSFNRLLKLGHSSSVLFADARRVRVVAAAGKGNAKCLEQEPAATDRLTASLSWLTSAQCRQLFTSSLSGVPEVLSTLSDGNGTANDSALDTSVVLSSKHLSVSHFAEGEPALQHCLQSLCAAFSRTVSAILAEFPSEELQGLHGAFAVRQRGPSAWSLVTLLRYGLHKLMHKPSQSGKMLSHQCMDVVEEHVTELLGRLRDCEVERSKLRLQLSSSEDELGRLSEACQQINILQTTMKRLEQDAEETVPKRLYDRLIVDSQANRQYIKEQEIKIGELTRKLDRKENDSMETEATLAQAVKSLTDMKMEVQRRGESVQRLRNQLSSVEDDKQSLQSDLQLCQLSLKAAIREKDLILEYLLAVDEALQTTVGQVSARQLVTEHNVALPSLPKLESPDHTELQVSSHVAACQAIVRQVIDFHHQAATAIASLRAEIESHRARAAALHAELTTAYQRQMEQD